jgi:hypothetical protein
MINSKEYGRQQACPVVSTFAWNNGTTTEVPNEDLLPLYGDLKLRLLNMNQDC